LPRLPRLKRLGGVLARWFWLGRILNLGNFGNLGNVGNAVCPPCLE
jgi:hypothetical protein